VLDNVLQPYILLLRCSTVAAEESETMDIDGQIAKHSGSPCSHLLVYVHEFIGGNLAGIKFEDSLPFCSESDARDWVKTINAKAKRGKLNYSVVEHVVTRLGR
jgi:hypothetical protein